MTVELTSDQACPCGSEQSYGDCCAPFHRGVVTPVTPEQLMRSRYSAYTLHDATYLQQSWHPSTRPAALELPLEMQWLGLDLIDAPAPEGNQGWVEFSARFRHAGRVEQLHERSRFVYEEGHWFYIDGLIHDNTKPAKIGRNDPCPCGSGGKYKRCCGSSG